MPSKLMRAAASFLCATPSQALPAIAIATATSHPIITGQIAMQPNKSLHSVLSKDEQISGFKRFIARTSKVTRQILNKVWLVAASACVLSALALPAFAQEVSNPDFEDSAPCAAATPASTTWPAVPGWTRPTGEPSYFFKTGCFEASPYFSSAAIPPQSGGSFAIVHAEQASLDDKGYLTNQLTSPLAAGQSYVLTFWVRSNINTNGTKDFTNASGGGITPANQGFFGALFSPNAPVRADTTDGNYGSIKNTYVPAGRTYIPAGNSAYSSNTWTKVSLPFTATGGEQFMTIGQFRQGVGGAGMSSRAYMYIDNFTLTPNVVLTKAVSTAPATSPATIPDGGTATYTFTLTNTAALNVAKSGLSFTDLLPSNLRIAALPNVVISNLTGGSVNAPANGTTVTVSNYNLAANTTGTIKVNVTNVVNQRNASCGAPAAFTNLPANITSISGNMDNSVGSVCLVVTPAPPRLTKAFLTTSIPAGTQSTLRFTITNYTGNPAQTGMGFTDTLPGGLKLAAVPTASQCGGSVSGTVGAGTITFTGGTFATGVASCTLDVSVTTATTPTVGACPQANNTNGPTNINPLANLGNFVTAQCLVVTAAPPTLSLRKALGGTGRNAAADQFGVQILTGGTGGTVVSSTANATTTGAGATVTAGTGYTGVFTGTAGTVYTLNELMAGGTSTLGQYTQTLSCTNTGTTNVSGLTTVPVTVTPVAGDAITCTVTNTPKAPTLSLQKALGGIGRIVAADQFGVRILTGGTGGTVVSSTANATTTGAGATVTAGTGFTGVFTGTAGTTYTFNELMAGGTSTLGQYGQAMVCTNTGPTNVSGLTTFPVSVTPVAGDAITCTVTNTPKAPTLSLQKALGGSGRIAAADQFGVRILTGGTGGTVVSSTANATTTGAGATVTAGTGFTGVFTGTAGTVYTLNELMAGGSTSTLAQYGQTVSCTNPTGTTSVTGFTSLPINVAPVYGDAISCTVTNTPNPTLQTVKTWGANSPASDTAIIAATMGGTPSNAPTFSTTGGTAGNSGAAVTVTVGNTITFPAETFSPAGSAANYTTLLACTANAGATANALSGTNGQASNTLVIGAADVGKAIVCTYTNALQAVDLQIVKSQRLGVVGTFSTSALRASSTDTVQYQLVIGNNGPVAANGATFSDALPANFTGVSVVSATGGAGAACAATAAGNTVSGTVTTLPNGGTCTVLIQATATALTDSGTGVVNTATVTAPASVSDSSAANNTSAVTTFIDGTVTVNLVVVGTPPAGDNGLFNLTFPGTPVLGPARTDALNQGNGGTTGKQKIYANSGATQNTVFFNETATAGSNLSNYTTSTSCTVGMGGSPPASNAFFFVGAGNTGSAADVVCTITNTVIGTATLQTTKVWGLNSPSSDIATIAASSGGAPGNTASFNAPGGTPANSGAAVTVRVGNTLTFPAETFSPAGSAANYNTLLACTAGGGATANALSGTNGQASNTLVIGAADSGKAIVCTFTNTLKTTLQTAKAWGANSPSSDTANINASAGGAPSNTAAFSTVGGTPATSAAVAVTVGNTITFLAETFSPTGSAANYTTQLACTAGGGVTANALSGTNGQANNTLVIGAADAGKAIVCTYTNVPNTTLQTAKAWGTAIAAPASDTANVPASTGGAPGNTPPFSAVGGTPGSSGAAVTVTIGNTLVFAAETFSPAANASNYTTVLTCTANGGATANALSGTNGQTSNTLMLGAADVGKAIVCTYTNSVKRRLSLTKSFSPTAVPMNTPTSRVTLTFSTGQQTDSITLTDALPAGLVIAPAPNVQQATVSGICYSAGAWYTATPGSTQFVISTNGGTAYYTPDGVCTVSFDVVASASGSYTNNIPAGAVNSSAGDTNPSAAIATLTVTPPTTLQTAKAWGPNSPSSDTANVPASTGGTPGNTAAFSTVGGTPANSAVVTVAVGNTLTFPPETITPGARASAYTTVLACTAGGGATANTLSGTNGQVSNTLLVGAADVGKAIVCTYTNKTPPADPTRSGVRVVTNSKSASGLAADSDVLEAYIADTNGDSMGGVTVSFDATGTVAFNGGAVGAVGSCVTSTVVGPNFGTCQITATSTVAGSKSTDVRIGSALLTGNFTAAANSQVYAPSPAVYNFVSSVPSVRIVKNVVSGSGSNQFNFALSGLSAASDTITVVGVGSVNGNSGLTGTANTGVTIAETSPTGWPANPVSASCVDSQTTQSGNPTGPLGTLSGNVLSIPAANMRNGAAFTCTFNNAFGFNVSGRVFNDKGNSAGTPNDGVINGGEAGIGGVVVKLTNCASTTYATATTNASGNYLLSVPSSTATGAQLCVEETNLGSSVSTGASVGSMALPSLTPKLAPDGTTYTYTRSGTPDRIAFTFNGSVHSGLNFGDVGLNTFGADGAKNGQIGNTVSYPHTFTAQTGGAVSFGIASSVATPALSGWSEKIFADPLCTGALQAGAALLFPPAVATTVIEGQQVCVIVQEFIPTTAINGYINTVKVQADFIFTNAAPTLQASYQVTDVTTVGSGALDLKKQVRNFTQSGVFGINNQAKTGETLEYIITYTNNGDSPLTNLVIGDTTPTYTTFISALVGTTPASLSSCQKNTPANALPAVAVVCATPQTSGGTGAINFQFAGPLNPGGTGTVVFQVKVD